MLIQKDIGFFFPSDSKLYLEDSINSPGLKTTCMLQILHSSHFTSEGQIRTLNCPPIIYLHLCVFQTSQTSCLQLSLSSPLDPLLLPFPIFAISLNVTCIHLQHSRMKLESPNCFLSHLPPSCTINRQDKLLLPSQIIDPLRSLQSHSRHPPPKPPYFSPERPFTGVAFLSPSTTIHSPRCRERHLSKWNVWSTSTVPNCP